MFSVIDALMDTPIDEVLASIPFPGDMRQALIGHAGEKGVLLDCVQALEAGDFDRAEALVASAAATYLDALVWANEAANPLLDDGAATATDSVAA
jgi:EAL and modified HD-GYP domain-containing signal transduction protein